MTTGPGGAGGSLAWSVFWSGRRLAARGRCPRCGDGRLFASRFKLRASCEACGLVYRRESGSQTGSMYLTAATTEIFAALLCVAIFFFTDFGAWTSIGLALPVVLLFSYWFLPKSMATWVAVEFASDVSNGDVEARPPTSITAPGSSGPRAQKTRESRK